MKEKITARVGRIVSASINAMVDAVENVAPEMVMEEAVREVEGVVEEVRAELGKVLAGKHLAGKRLAEEKARHSDLAEKAALAVEQGREDLAEAAISRQLDIEAQLPILEKSIREAEEKERELEGYIVALQAKRREMKEELQRFAKTQPAGGTTPGTPGKGPDYSGKVAKAESAFERVMEKNTGVPGPAGKATDAAKLAELEELARQNRIKERLAALKASDKA